MRFSRLVKATSYYPDAHPSVNQAVNACTEAFKSCLAANQDGYISIEIRRQGFMRNDAWLDPENKILPHLAQSFFLRKIKALAVFPNLREQHLLTLAHCLGQEPQQLESKGGAVHVLEQAQASSILLNEINLAAISSHKYKTATVQPAPKNTSTHNGNTAHSDNMAAKNGGGQGESSRSPATSGDQAIIHLLRKAQQLMDTGAQENISLFQASLEKIRRHLDRDMASAQHHADVMQTMVHFDKWISSRTYSPQYTELCRQCLHSLDQTKVVMLLLDAAGHDSNHHAMVIRLIKRLNTDSSAIVWQQLISEPDPKMRRFLAATMEALGSAADKVMLASLDGSRWFIIRNALKILGSRRNPDYIQAFSAQLSYSDSRVVKEALSALSAIRHDKAVDALLNYLDSPDCALPELTIMALGVQKNPRAIPLLSQIALQRDSMLKQKKTRLKAIEALGDMRHPAANEALATIARKGKILKHGEYQELRLAAITALGKTATSAERKILQDLCTSRDSAIAQCARLALQNSQKDTAP